MPPMKLLIIEDEKGLSDSIVRYLRNEEYLCEQAFTSTVEAYLRSISNAILW